MLETALKYDPGLFGRGAIELQWPWSMYALGVLGLALVVALGYARRAPALATRERAGLWALRTALLALLLFVLLDPHLRVEMEKAIPGQAMVLLDDSLSMRIRDRERGARSAFVEAAFLPGTGSIARALEQRVDTRYLRFANSVEPLAAGERPAFAGTRSNLAQALTRVARGDRSKTLTSVIVVSDGAAGDTAALDESARALRAAGITLHAVGVGAERYQQDLEVAAVRAPRRVLRGDRVQAEIVISHRGLSGESVALTVVDNSAVVAEVPVTLPADGSPATVRVPLAFTEPGARRLDFRLAPRPDETVTENNVARHAVDVRGDPVRILHIEGEPRFEVKFLRRAVGQDEGIELVSLIRTAENKYYRLGVEDADELAGGLPDTDEALFRYDAVVLGSIGDDLVDAAQQERLRDFVARRGGGLVLLGGRSAFGEGGYARSTLAGVAPVVIPVAPSGFQVRVPVRPTPTGLSDPLLRLGTGLAQGETEAASQHTAWDRLPPLTVVNPIRRTKPGATTLLRGTDHQGEPLVVLAWQRYGRGTVTAFPVRDSWRWQMHGDVPLADQTHERLWRNLLRHVARPAGGRLRLHIEPRRAVPGDTVTVRAEALDAAYRPADADVTLAVTTPAGDVQEILFERSLKDEGLYQASFAVRDIGRYHLRATLEEPVARDIEVDAAVEVSGVGREFHGAELDAARLERLAASTGGRFFRAAAAGGVVDAVNAAAGTRVVERRLPLRDMPLLLALLIALACLEWLWRRRRDLA